MSTLIRCGKGRAEGGIANCCKKLPDCMALYKNSFQVGHIAAAAAKADPSCRVLCEFSSRLLGLKTKGGRVRKAKNSLNMKGAAILQQTAAEAGKAMTHRVSREELFGLSRREN